MSRKQAGTPRSRVRASLRALWLRSRERAAAIKRENGCCEECGKKQSSAKGKEFKIEVHHREHILNWDLLFEYIYRHLLCHPDELQVLCKECHDHQHGNESNAVTSTNRTSHKNNDKTPGKEYKPLAQTRSPVEGNSEGA